MNCPFCNTPIDKHEASPYDSCLDKWIYILKNKSKKLSYLIQSRDADHGCHDNIETEFETANIAKVYPEYIRQSKLQRISTHIHILHNGEEIKAPNYSMDLNDAMPLWAGGAWRLSESNHIISKEKRSWYIKDCHITSEILGEGKTPALAICRAFLFVQINNEIYIETENDV